jgi:hypothetical protein
MSDIEKYFGEGWKQFAPHPLIQAWLPFVGTVISLLTAIVGLAVSMMTFENQKKRK